MKLSIALLATLTGVGAFVPSHPTTCRRWVKSSFSSAPSSSSLCIGFDVNESYTTEYEEKLEAQREMAEYLNQPSPVALRPNLGTSILISGFDPTDVASTMVLDFLNTEDSPQFPFTTIVAHVDDVTLAKKRMIGRNARYTGLLDKLKFVASESSGELPTADQLKEVSSWVVNMASGDISKLAGIIDAAESAQSVQNVAILVSGAQSLDDEVLKEAAEMLSSKASSFAYTMIVVGELNDMPEAQCAYGLVNITDAVGAESGPLIPAAESFSREESLRLVTECLALDSARGKCMVATSAPDSECLESRLIQGMRELGYTRPQEIDHMVAKGAKAYNDAMAENEAENNAIFETNPEKDAEIDAVRAKQAAQKAEAMARNAEARKEEQKMQEVEAMAREWAAREYRKKSAQGKRPMVPPNEYFDYVRERAMFESEMKWRTMQGLSVNESEERKAFKEEQNKKRAEVFGELTKKFGEYNFEDYQMEEEMGKLKKKEKGSEVW